MNFFDDTATSTDDPLDNFHELLHGVILFFTSLCHHGCGLV